jgi:hypothetical protein
MTRPVASNRRLAASRRLGSPAYGNDAPPLSARSSGRVAEALACADRGWPVFPCRSGTKEPATRHGFHDASTDPEQIRSWWHRWPDANLAIATGAPGPDVLDVDQHGTAGHGYTALMQLKHADLLDGAGTIVRTPHGGLHVYFTGTSQASGRLPRQHLDFKSSGGYVVVPPSEVDGRPYYLVRRAEASGSLDWSAATRILEPQLDRTPSPAMKASDDIGRLAAWVERLEEGNRNSGLFWAACRAVEAGQPNALDQIAAAASRTGLSDREIGRTIESARRNGQRGADWQPNREATL